MLCIVANALLLVLNYIGTSQCTVFRPCGEKRQKGRTGNHSVRSVPCICRLECTEVIAALKQDLQMVLERKCRP